MEKEERQSFSAHGWVNKAGKFIVEAITTGEGNGWRFSEEVLKESLPLWEGVECFVDHSLSSQERSVKDLGGVFISPYWSEETQGIRLELQTGGPSGDLVKEIGAQMTADGNGAKPRVGFSADVLFTAKGKEIKKILKVFELDLVFNPARGGAFIRSLNSKTNQLIGVNMTEEIKQELQTDHDNKPVLNSDISVINQMSQEAEEIRKLLEVQEEIKNFETQAKEAREIRKKMCEYLLDSALAGSNLPKPMKSHIRKRFQGTIFDPYELSEEIDGARDLVADLSGGSSVVGSNFRISNMFNSEDQLQASVDDLLNAPREKSAESLKTARLSGIKELYMLLTGDRDLYGGYFAERVQLATTASFTGLVKNALNKIVVNQWQTLGRAGYDWWVKITTQENFTSLHQITGTLIGTVGTLPTVQEGAEYAELEIGDSPETAEFTKYGGYIPLTLELIDRDETRKLKSYPRELASAGLRKISSLVAEIFTANAGVGPAMADGGNLFNPTPVTTAGGHANISTSPLTNTAWEIASQAVYDQPMLIKNTVGYFGTGPKMAVNPRYLLVPRALQLTGRKILEPYWENTSNIHSENLQKGETGDVITVPEWNDSNDWAVLCDPLLAPAIYIGERFGIMPEIFIAGDEHSPAVFTNDEHRLKVRHFLAVWVNDFRPLHKSNVP